MKIINYKSVDATLQPAIFYNPQINIPRPLLVGLHQWSTSCFDKNERSFYEKWCKENDWIFILPNFRGSNNKADATGSDLVIGDVAKSVEYACNNSNVDSSRIYLAGVSGGGYTSLLMAGRKPEIWAAVSAWVPIVDLVAWYYQSRKRGLKYADDIIVSCNGIPEINTKAYHEAINRSPLAYLKAANMPIDLNAGINDGHEGSVPISHTLIAFNELAAKEDHLTDSQIKLFVEKKQVPLELLGNYNDDHYGLKKLLFRRESNNVRVSIFDGGHEIIADAALKWLSTKRKKMS